MTAWMRFGGCLLAGFSLAGCEVLDYSTSKHSDDPEPATIDSAAAPAESGTVKAESVPETAAAPAGEDPGLPAAGTSLQIPSRDGGGGFVSNPDNSRGVLKIIWPSRYSGHITGVTAGQAGFSDRLLRALPNEDGDRERYYGSHAPSAYPANLVVTAALDTGGSVYVILPNPAQRYD